ncbi:MAG: DICT sensory domain-containing protein [Xenococcaceae cyanobacterium]
MNLPPTPELSLYKLTQGLDRSPQPLVVSATTLHTLVGAFIDLLIEQQLVTTVWVKLPRTDGWLKEIKRYQQQRRADLIYLCSIKGATPSPSSFGQPSSQRYQPASRIVPIQLEASSQLKRESFLVVLSPQFCGLILAEQQTVKGPPKQLPAEPQPPHLKMVCSFEPSVIQRVLAGIKQAIAISDTTPEDLLTDSDFPFPFPSSPNSALLANLLLKQVQRTEAIQPDETFPTLQTTTATLTESLHLKDEFVRHLARELRTPLTHMKTALSLLESKQSKERRKRYLELLHRECDRQNSLISGLLELVQLDHTPVISVSPVLLEDFVPGIVSTYQPLAEEKGIQLGYTIPAGFPPISCPTPWLRQIILNLLNNSLKFTPPNGRVSVQAALKNECVELTFSDTGIGIATSDLPKIFNSFYRGRTANGEDTIGAGLGLTVVQQLLRRCGGSISVTSKLGKGSTFKVLLPVASAQLEDE